jgi:hypothetical protein
MPQPIPAQSSSTERDELLVAYEAVLPDIAAVPDDQLLPVTLDVLGAVATVAGVLPRLRDLRSQLEAELPRFDLIRFDKLEQYAQALTLLQGVHRSTTAPKLDVATQGAELTTIRDRLYSSAVALVDCGLLDGARFKSCKREIGYRAIAEDVLTLVALFLDNTAAVQGRTALDLSLLGKWRTQAFALIEAVGVREQAPASAGEVGLTRRKALTLLVRTYEKARYAIGYLRAEEGDADDIAPSLYAGRAPARRVTKQPSQPRPAETAETADPTNDAATNDRASPAVPPIRIENPHGLPLTSPFSA